MLPVLLAIGLTMTVLAQVGAAAETFRIEETLLGPLDTEILSPVFSRGGTHLAYVTHRGRKECVVVDGKAGEAYDGIAGTVFSSDGQRVAYRALKGPRQLVVVDGKAGAEYEGIARPV